MQTKQRGMGKAGRAPKPKPVALENRPDPNTPPPDYLNQHAVDYWHRTFPLVLPTMHFSDLEAFGQLCASFGQMVEAQQDIKTRGNLVMNEKTGSLSKNPSFMIVSQTRQQWQVLAARFGLTPADRKEELNKAAIPEKASIFDQLP